MIPRRDGWRADVGGTPTVSAAGVVVNYEGLNLDLTCRMLLQVSYGLRSHAATADQPVVARCYRRLQRNL